jgi:hypothetical protein
MTLRQTIISSTGIRPEATSLVGYPAELVCAIEKGRNRFSVFFFIQEKLATTATTTCKPSSSTVAGKQERQVPSTVRYSLLFSDQVADWL